MVIELRFLGAFVRRFLALALVLIVCAPPATAAEADDTVPYLMLNGLPVTTGFDATSAHETAMNGTWRFLEDPDDVGEQQGWQDRGHERSDWRTIEVPGSWDVAFGDELLGYRGAGWYARGFPAPARSAGERVRIRFEAVFLVSDVWVNGQHVGSHTGGYTPFEVDVTDVLEDGENTLVVRADSRITRNTIPTDTLMFRGRHGWWPYGGITRDVRLLVDDAARPFKLDIRTRPTTPSAWTVDIAVGVHTSGAPATEALSIELADPTGTIVATAGPVDLTVADVAFERFSVVVDDPQVWDPSDPARYSATVRFGDTYAVDEFGFRTVEVADGDILLNGRRHFLRGMNRHEDHPTLGPVQTPELIAGDVALLGELDVNHIRPGHYPAHPDMLSALGKAGITMTEEIPVYQLDLFHFFDRQLLEQARTQLIEMVERDRNEPAIILWSLGNEVWQFVPQAGTFFASLHDTLDRYDDTRLSTYAAFTVPYLMSALPDSVTPLVDVVSVNEYYGWYYPAAAWAGFFLDLYHSKFPTKPFVVSEVGADALAGRHLDRPPGEEPPRQHSYSEEFQAWFLQRQFDQLLARDYVDGVMPWVFADFRMEWKAATAPHPVDQMNLKGLLSGDREPKLAFSTVSETYASLAAE